MKGFIIVPRNIQSTKLWGNPQYFYWWIDLVMQANYESTERVVGNTKVSLERGQLIASIMNLAGRWGCSRSSALRFVNFLITEGYVKRQTSNNISILTIVCYDQYQLGNSKALSPEKTAEPPLNHLSEPPLNHLVNHVQNHPFEPPCDENLSHLEIPISDCLSVVYGLLEDEGMNHLDMGFMNHPFEPEDEPPFDEIVNHPFEQKADHLFVPPITPSLEEKINNNLNNKKNISSSSSKKDVCVCTRGQGAHEGAHAGGDYDSETPLTGNKTKNSSNGIGVTESDVMSLLNEQQWCETLRMRYKLSIEEVKEYLKEFSNHLIITGKDETKFVCDLKSHFDSWLRIKLNEKEHKQYEQQIRRRNEELHEQKLQYYREQAGRRATELDRRRETQIAPVDESTRIHKVSHSDNW